MSQNNSSPGIVGYVPAYNVAVGNTISPFVIEGAAPGAAGTILTSNGTSSFPTFQPNSASSSAIFSITGDSGGAEVPLANNFNIHGTTNQILVAGSANTETLSLIGPYTPATYTTDGVLYGNGTSSIQATSAVNNGVLITSVTGVPSLLPNGSSGQILTATTGAAPSWGSNSAANAIITITGDSGGAESALSNNFNLKGTANQVAVTGSANTETFSLIGPYTPTTYALDGILYGNGTGSIQATTSVDNAVLITSASGVPSLLADGTTGQVLTATTGSPPSWVANSAANAIITITGDTGGAESASANNFNLKGTADQILVTGSANTETFSLIGPYTPATYTAHSVLLGEGAASIGTVGPTATAGQVLQSAGSSADPTFSTATYPSTTTIDQILFSSAANVVGGNAGLTYTPATSTFATDNASFKGPTPWADVTAYGADPTGAASSVAAFNAAIASISVGGIVWIPVGTYKIDSPVTVSTPHIRFCGASRTDCILNNTQVTGNTINLNTFYGGCENLTFTAPANTNTAGYAISMPAGADYSYVWRCDFTNMWSGILMENNLGYIDDIGMRTFSNAAVGGSCVYLNSSANNWINKLTTNNGAVLTGFAGVRIVQTGAVLVSNCQLIGATTAMSIEPTVGLTVPSVEVVNTFFDTSSTGLSVTGAGTPARCKFTNCWFSSQTIAGVTFNNANMTGFTFVNCDFYGNAIGINALACVDWQVSNSRIAGNTTAGIQTTAATAHSFQILDNTIGPTGVFGANALGINIQSGTYASYRIKGNIGLAANTTAGITDSGVVTGQNQKEVADNIGALIKGGIAANTAATGAINTAETIVAGGNGVNGSTAVIPANSLQVGTTIRIIMHGTCTSTAANVSTFTLRMGTAGTTADASVATAATSVAATSGTTVGFTAIMEFTVRTIGSTGTIAGTMLLLNTGITGISANNSQSISLTATATLNTTTANYIEVTYKSAATTTTSTFQNGIVEIVKC